MTDLESVRRVSVADVYKSGRKAATLSRTAHGGMEFRYLDKYISDNGEAIATTLPVRSVPISSAAGSVPTFFEGLLPEGHRLTVLRRAVKTSANDELSLLLAVGADVPGDVQVVPQGTTLVDPPALVQGPVAELDFETFVESIDTHAIPGVQRKASASMISVPLSASSGQFILKLSQEEYPYLVENEAAHLRAGRGLGLSVSEGELVEDRGGSTGLLVRRFDRVRSRERWQRLAFEDATQVMDLPPASKYGIEAESAVAALASVTAAPMIAIRNLHLQFLFAWLTGNGDLHGKNVGILRGLDGIWSVAPIYDIPCTLIYGDDSMALPINGRTRKLRSRDWDQFEETIGLRPRAAAKARALAVQAAAAIAWGTLPFRGSPLHRVERELRRRREELLG